MVRKLKDLTSVNLSGKTVVLRANLDVPLKDGEVADSTKIKLLIPTIQELIKNNCKVIVLGHIGEKTGEYNDAFSLMPVRFELGRTLQKPIKFVNIATCDNSIKFMEPGEILMLENLFFSKEEFAPKGKEKETFVRHLANFADFFVNEAYGVDEKLTSMIELPKMLKPIYGFNYIKELEAVEKFKNKPNSPFIGIVGGNNLSDKLPILKMLAKKADCILIGGAIAYDFLNYKKINIGKSNLTKNSKEEIKNIFDLADKKGCKILLPVDHIAVSEFSEKAKPIKISSSEIPENLMGMDIGPKTVELYRDAIENAKTIIWSGTMGVFEWENFYKGTEAIGEYVSLSAPKDSYKVAVGNDTLYAISRLKLKHKKFSHISAGANIFLKEIS
ncbi:MAG: phosphoglycerate kinase [Candidatus Dojkabacteria bacterium]